MFSTSSRYLSSERRLAFMKKLATVETLRPSCSAIVACISLAGRLVSLNIASRVRLWMSVKTRRGFLGDGFSCFGISVSFLLQAENTQDYYYKYIVYCNLHVNYLHVEA